MIEYKSGKVVLMDGSDKIEVIKKLYATERTKEKVFFNKALTYLFFMYRKESQYSGLAEKKRAPEVCKIYFGDKEHWKRFEFNDKFIAVKTYYEKLQYTPEERALLSSAEEIDDIILHLKDIKYFVDGEVDVEIMIPKSADSDEMVPRVIKQKIRVNNYKEKEASLKALSEIIKIRKLLKETVRSRTAEKKVEQSKSLLDNGGLDD